MKMNAISVFAVAAMAILPANVFASGAATPAAKESIALMQDLETTAYTVRLTAAGIEGLTRNPMQIGRASHANQLNLLKDQINSAVPVVARLAELKKDLPATDQVALAKTIDTTVRLSRDINGAILRAGEPVHFLSLDKQYVGLINSILVDSSALAHEADAAADFFRAREKAEKSGVRTVAGE